jgi:hypothetical protein
MKWKQDLNGAETTRASAQASKVGSPFNNTGREKFGF